MKKLTKYQLKSLVKKSIPLELLLVATVAAGTACSSSDMDIRTAGLIRFPEDEQGKKEIAPEKSDTESRIYTKRGAVSVVFEDDDNKKP